MNERIKILKEFLNKWSINKLKEMTLEEYTNLEGNSFCYWIESKTHYFGSIWGGSSYKFGIFKKKNNNVDLREHYISDGEYAWFGKYGDQKELAFNTIKGLIVKIAEYASKGEFKSIDKIQMGNAYKWKIAFLYSNERLLPIYKKDALKYITKSLNLKESNLFSELQQQLISKKPSEISIYAYSHNLWDSYSNYIKSNTVETINSLDMRISKNVNSYPLNSILYGPPGTGKTYNTINKALELCGEDTEGKSRAEIKELFDLIVDEGRIVFTTFHQSMTYEDFVEGIKPVEPEKEGDPLIFKVEKGIFRILCVSAAFSLAQERKSETTELLLDFSLAYDQFVEYINEKLPSKENIELTTKNGGNILVDDISSQGNIIIKHPGKSKTYSVSKERLSRINAAFPDLSKVNNIAQEFRSIIGGCNSTAIWSVLNAIRTKIFSYKNYNRTTHKYTFEEKEQVVQSLKKEDYNGKKGKAHVIIIDEINRGNVSQIFGELITLLEEDKRLGNSEALQVQLPYSKDWFGVPPNVYIIGTMNTADRSVEALDSALRRRFSFTEISPDTDLLKGEISNSFDFNLSTILETLNRRIEKLLDKDHMIGHSYFLKVNNIKDLKAVFQNNIIPLLQEYFFGDYGKIGLIIGANFFDIIDNQTEESFFAHFDDYDTSPFIEKKIYHLKNVLKMPDEEFINAIHIFLGQKS